MIGWAGQWTQTPSSTPIQPKKWNAHFCITFNIWCWPNWSMDLNLIHHPSPAKNMKCSFLGYIQLLMISWAVRWTQTPSAIPLQPKKWNAHFLIIFNFWWSAGLVDGLKPHLLCLCSQKNEMLIFVLHSTSDVGQTGQWTQTPSTTPLQPKKWNASFKDYTQLLMIGRAEWWTQTPSTTPLQPKKIKCLFLDYVHFWWSAWLIDELELHLPPLSYQKNEMLNFWLRSTSDDQPSWSIDSKSICQPSPANKMKCFFLDYVQLLMISQAGWWTWTPSATLLQPKKWNAHFWIMFILDDQPGWSMDSNPILHLSPAKTVKCSFLYYIQHLMLARLVNGFEPHPPPLSSQKNKMLIFWLYSTSDDQLGWSMDLNPICQPSPANKMKCYFLDYVQLLMLARLVNGLKPHPSPLSSQRNEILILWSCSTSHDQLDWSVDSNPIHYPSPAKQMKCSFFDPVQLLMISCAGQWT